ncbi:hypothetical protein FA95DRAFT_1611504 [Auriscalpium vulgare]|uniref:Uncharacterized protein n=1 Tax=Auriscalpium vulgare TaxID=40419 RepID=A0ACB8R9X8_9AGAM|nr:hypothetical protein FA95DRAFT_1611504 [Auriscalpium vulgare]
MVSDLWKASQDGNLASVHDLAAQATPADLEIKDQDGVTPLIAAVKNGHYDVVKALLFHGAHPLHASAQGLPEQYTSDAAILELLRTAAPPKINPDLAHQDQGYAHDPSLMPPKGYYLQPPGPYAYYPGMPVPPLPEGGVPFYPPPVSPAEDQGQQQPSPNAQPPPPQSGNMPPPEIARLIPCRYFPACRYGASCMFAHPQGPFYPSPMSPPAQYPAQYEHAPPQAYPPNFYAMPPPPSFQTPNGLPPPHLTPVSPQSASQSAPPPPPFAHHGASAEILSPVQGPFSPNGGPGPVPYGPMSPTSPSSYPHANHVPVPLSAPPLPPPQHIAPPGPQSPTAPYPAVNGPYEQRHDGAGQYPPPPLAQRPPPDTNGVHKSPPQQGPDAFGPNGHREPTANRRGGFRRPSFASRKPPCLFFPAGRCRNGDECRFPHVLPDASAPHPPGHFGRGGRFRPAQNGTAHLEEKLANLGLRDDGAPQASSGSTTPSDRPRPSPSHKQFSSLPNGTRPAVRAPVPKQRVPGADEFPVLGGATTPPARSPGPNGHIGLSGPTAAQVLQAPPMRRGDSKDSLSAPSEPTPEPARQTQAPKAAPEPPVIPATPREHVVSRLPISFAAVANGAADHSKEVSVSA